MAETIDVWRVEADPRKSVAPDWVEPQWWRQELHVDGYGRQWTVPFLLVPMPPEGFARVFVGECLARDSHGHVSPCTPETFEAVRRGS